MPSLVRKHALSQQERNSVRELVVGEARLGLINVDGCVTTRQQKAVDRREHLFQFFMNNIVIS
jgi:hypothetical protein